MSEVNKGGRPAKWDDPKAFSDAVDEYFNLQDVLHTWTGLAMHLGFESRQSLEDYKHKEGFTYPIKKALLRIENKYENRMITEKNPTGSIFALKNFGWKDKQEIDQKTTVKDERIDATKLTDDELRVLAEIQRKSGASEA